MFAQERHSHILQLLERQGRVRVAALAKRLRVTEETVRRDLERLGNDGKLLRTHGGALNVEQQRREQPFDIRKTAQRDEKVAIALTAAAQVVEGEVIAIDGSSSAYELACSLPDIAVTVITTSVPVINALAERSRLRVVGAGGTLDATSMSFSGSITDQVLSQLNIDKLFMSCKGVDPERGLSETTEGLAAVKRRLIERAARTYLLADHTKFGVRSTVVFAAVADVDVVVTDHDADPEILARLASAGPTILTAS